MTKAEEIENKIIELLNEANEHLNEEEFDSLGSSVIDYIDEIDQAKRNS